MPDWITAVAALVVVALAWRALYFSRQSVKESRLNVAVPYPQPVKISLWTSMPRQRGQRSDLALIVASVGTFHASIAAFERRAG